VKKYSFPRQSALLKKQFNPTNKVRAALVLALIALVSSLPFYVFAQDDGAPTPKKSRSYSVDADRGAFVIYAGPNGETLCRAATLAETRAMRSGTSDGLRQINHLRNQNLSTLGPNSVQSATGLTIILRATAQLDANPAAKQAFIAAAARWEALIKDPITIAIDVDFGTTFFGTPFSDENVLGATSSPQFSFTGNYPDVRQRLINHALAGSAEATLDAALPASAVPTDIGSVDRIFVVSPLLRALGSFPPDFNNDPPSPAIPAPRIGFNSAFGFDFDPSNGISSNQTDFDAVAVHEMGHALGFASEVGDRELNPGATLGMTVWDLFRFRPGTANLNNFGTAQRILSSGGPQVQFSGGPELGLSTGKPDGTGGDGNQASHWKDNVLNGGNFIGIMDPTISRGVRETMTSDDQSAIDTFGYLITPSTPPPNDNFVDAQVITGTSGSVTGTNAFATKEVGEPSHSPDGNLGGRSVWYRWTAPSSGTANLTTAGSNFDTLLGVWTGSAVNGLTLVVRNDDVDLGVITTSAVQFTAVGGTTYQIAVDGFDGDQGSITLNFTLPGAPTPTPTPTPGPNTVQFSASTASATETANATTHVDLQVTRTGNIAQAATVNYATTDATASERSDYQATLGTLHFAANEGVKTIPVFIVNDAFGESAETFNITLSGPVGCTLGSPAAMVITINSDEAVNGSNPVKDATFDTDFFVRQHYVDFFNREADAPGLAFWKNEIDSCATAQCREIKRINVSAAFFLSIEFQQTGYLVYKTYQAAFDTHELLRLRNFLPDTQEIGRGVVFGAPGADALLEANKVKFFEDFVQRAAFVAPAAYPTTMTAAQFVDKLNSFTYDPSTPGGPGSLTTGERDALVAQLSPNPASPVLRAQVLRAIAENSVFHNRQFNRAFVLMQYFGYLRRNPDDIGFDGQPDPTFSGYNFWLSKLNQFNGNFINAEMVKAFITSFEYQARFGPLN
jgi:hypothetical protein